MRNFDEVSTRPRTHYGHIVYDGQYTDPKTGLVRNIMHVTHTSRMYIDMNRLEREIHAQHGRPPVNERPEPIAQLDDGSCWKRDENGNVRVIRVPKDKKQPVAHVAQIRGTNHSRSTRGKRH